MGELADTRRGLRKVEATGESARGPGADVRGVEEREARRKGEAVDEGELRQQPGDILADDREGRRSRSPQARRDDFIPDRAIFPPEIRSAEAGRQGRTGRQRPAVLAKTRRQ